MKLIRRLKLKWDFFLAKLFGRKYIGIDYGSSTSDKCVKVTSYARNGHIYVTDVEEL